ncbi:hypothetical protein [Peribacillus frigoritolerans]|uniref:hypothetical protein n=1 Tax=Peribacillus frigoritolerans TaxID=450367 RepID=UPI0031D4B27E
MFETPAGKASPRETPQAQGAPRRLPDRPRKASAWSGNQLPEPVPFPPVNKRPSI